MALAFLGLTGCSKKAEPSAEPQVVSGVRSFQVATEKLPEIVDLVGTVRAKESATLSPQVMGTIASIAVREGDHVRAGQPLISIEAAQLAAQSSQAEATLAAMEQQKAAAESEAALAASTLKRYEILKQQKSISPQEFDEVQSRSQAAASRLAMAGAQESEAKAAVTAARTMQGYTRIHAPFDGVVTERKADPGVMATPGVPILTIEHAGALRLEVAVDESLLSGIHVGQAIPVVIDALDGAAGSAVLEGKVAEIVPAADAASRSFLVKIDLPSVAGLHSGMSGHARLARGTRDAVVIPRSALVARGSLQSVYVIGPDQIAQPRYVSTGLSHGDSVEVLSGLSAGETVIDSPGERELSGKRIEAKP